MEKNNLEITIYRKSYLQAAQKLRQSAILLKPCER